MPALILPSRRLFLATAALGSAHFTVQGAFAEDLARSPRVTEGPFYPDKLPLDTDNDLLIVNDALTPAVGTVTHLSGRVLTPSGSPVRGVTVEIWQVDAHGAYLHSGTSNADKRDKQFQGFGRFTTAGTGEFYFRTVKPVKYPGRCPHVHVKVKKGGKELLCTQFFVAGDPANDRDGIYRGIRDPKQKALVTSKYEPLEGSKAGEVTARYDIVLGVTPADADHG